MSVEPIEMVPITAADLLVAWIAWVVITLGAVAVTVWALRPDNSASEDDDDLDVTVELPRPGRGRRQPNTGALCPACFPDEQPTVRLPEREVWL